MYIYIYILGTIIYIYIYTRYKVEWDQARLSVTEIPHMGISQAALVCKCFAAVYMCCSPKDAWVILRDIHIHIYIYIHNMYIYIYVYNISYIYIYICIYMEKSNYVKITKFQIYGWYFYIFSQL